VTSERGAAVLAERTMKAHLPRRTLDSALPHAAQNFLFVVLSVPHLLQRIALFENPSNSLSL